MYLDVRILDKSRCCIQNNNIYYLSTSNEKQLLQYSIKENEWKEITLSTHFSNGELLSDPVNPNLLWITSRRTIIESKSEVSLQLSIWKYDIKQYNYLFIYYSNELTKIKNHKTSVTIDDEDEKVIEASPFSMIFETYIFLIILEIVIIRNRIFVLLLLIHMVSFIYLYQQIVR